MFICHNLQIASILALITQFACMASQKQIMKNHTDQVGNNLFSFILIMGIVVCFFKLISDCLVICGAINVSKNAMYWKWILNHSIDSQCILLNMHFKFHLRKFNNLFCCCFVYLCSKRHVKSPFGLRSICAQLSMCSSLRYSFMTCSSSTNRTLNLRMCLFWRLSYSSQTVSAYFAILQSLNLICNFA